MYILLIILLGFGLRLININKLEGLWNDEYVSWFVSSTAFKEGFLQEIVKQCHMPLYYFYLKPFAIFNDTVLRLTSVIPSVIAIFVMYLVGKEFSKKNGYICGTITSILPFLIYYSQEVRFYSLLFLLSALSLLFLIKLTKGKNYWKHFALTSVFILLTHVLGIIYIGLCLLYLAYKKKKLTTRILVYSLIPLICLIPFGINILKMIPSSQWWGEFSYTNILFLFSDYFSPILTNNINAPKIFFYSNNLLFISLILFPTLIALYFIVKGVKQKKWLVIVAIGVILATAILAISGKIVFITKYTIEILPTLILLLALGVNGRFGYLMLSAFISFQLFSVFTPYYPAKTFRSEGHRLVCEELNKKNPDAILFTYYEPNRFYRYLKLDSKMYYISKINRFDYKYETKNFIEKIQIGEKVSVVFLDSVSFIPGNWIEKAKDQNLPEMFITFSEIRNFLIKELYINFTDFQVEKVGSWTVITAKKLK